jgi:hypothetical protein
MNSRRHHGKDRLLDIGKIDGTNVLLTTYQTVSADWKKWKSSGTTILFSVQWKRIILDEGSCERFIRNTEAVCLARYGC